MILGNSKLDICERRRQLTMTGPGGGNLASKRAQATLERLVGMIRNVFAVIVAASLALSVSDLSAHAQAADKFRTGMRAYDASKFKIAFKILKPLAEQGHAEAQLIVADMYNIGKGVQQDNSSAISWYRKSAAQGNTEAIQMLGQGMRLFGETSGN